MCFISRHHIIIANNIYIHMDIIQTCIWVHIYKYMTLVYQQPAYIKYLITLTYQVNLHKSEENVMTFRYINRIIENNFLKIINF